MVDAAEELYAEFGWDAVTMDRVAKSARLSRALLYVYFRDKNDLLHAITERSLLGPRALRRRGGEHAPGIDHAAIGRAYAFPAENSRSMLARAFTRTMPRDIRLRRPARRGDAVIRVIVEAARKGRRTAPFVGIAARQVCLMPGRSRAHPDRVQQDGGNRTPRVDTRTHGRLVRNAC
jgi:AcrR family transcriptional regulator